MEDLAAVVDVGVVAVISPVADETIRDFFPNRRSVRRKGQQLRSVGADGNL